ncbi:hypothetical protein B0I33_108232 [Prauserella shujinwangii]|uniref:CidA/LrgA family protein n=1 Tax=Prauserella shujinwangii TaxID=1453103 RepID=A0A2T0LRL6_9PSEU|nr:B-4DMT family transporter [Prauserella shujinwangii]PRX46085.1 hypothetical protein B0I33_108232 [Prauserella shujinwangii]
MPSWVLRALVLALLHAAAVVARAKIAVVHPTDSSVTEAVLLAMLVGVAALWGALDGWSRLADAGRTWFIAALVAGPVAGVLSVVGRGMFVDQTGVSALGAALTGGAAFTALLVLVPAGLGLAVGGRIGTPRGSEPSAEDAQERGPRVGPAG